MFQAGVLGGKRALAIGSGRGRERRHLLERGAASERVRVRSALGHQRLEQLAHRDQAASSRVDQPSLHSVARSEETVLGQDLGAWHGR